jgi:hypothetical protein
MGVTKTVHPPAGATALLCSTNAEVTALGWYFLPLVMVGSTLLVAVGCVVNNIQRTFPVYWWTPIDLRRGESDIEIAKEGKGGEEEGQTYVREREDVISVSGKRIVVPEWMELDYEEKAMLEILRKRVGEGRPREVQGLEGSRSRDSEITKVGVGGDGGEGEVGEVR